MRILVTGGAGYIGSHACAALAAAGHDPIVYDNLSTGHAWAAQWGPLVHGDILDLERLVTAMKVHRPDAVMHFAARAYVGESVIDPAAYYWTNVTGSLTLLHAMRIADVRTIVFSSTCAVYGLASAPIRENDPKAPVNPYGRSKLMVEQALEDQASAYGLGVVCLRYFNAAGADPEGRIGEEHDPEPHLLPRILQTAAGLLPAIDIFGADYTTPDGTCIRDYIHVTDLAEAHVKALQVAKPGKMQAFNLGTGAGHSVLEMLDAARAVTGRDIPANIRGRRAGDPPSLIAAAEAGRAALGWEPVHSGLHEMIASSWRWMSEHRSKVGLPALLRPTISTRTP